MMFKIIFEENADVKIVNNWDDIAVLEEYFYWTSDDPESNEYRKI